MVTVTVRRERDREELKAGLEANKQRSSGLTFGVGAGGMGRMNDLDSVLGLPILDDEKAVGMNRV